MKDMNKKEITIRSSVVEYLTFELSEDTDIRNFRITAKDNKLYDTMHYNLKGIPEVFLENLFAIISGIYQSEMTANMLHLVEMQLLVARRTHPSFRSHLVEMRIFVH